MREKDLPIDRTCHVVYSKGCKAQIQGAIACHYPEGEREAVWEAVQRKYVDCLSQWRTDLGGSKNFHNGPGSIRSMWTRPATAATAEEGIP